MKEDQKIFLGKSAEALKVDKLFGLSENLIVRMNTTEPHPSEASIETYASGLPITNCNVLQFLLFIIRISLILESPGFFV
jgi:hypothetical protein